MDVDARQAWELRLPGWDLLRARMHPAPAVDNSANRALVEFIAQRLGIAKSRVSIVSGGASRRKMLEIDGVGADVIAAALGPKARVIQTRN